MIKAVESLKLICKGCSTPVAEVSEGLLIIRSVHHGEQHVTKMLLSDLTNLQASAYALPNKSA